MTVGCMFSTVPLRPARTHPFVSAVYFHFRYSQLSLYLNLLCFDSISARDNLVELSGAVRQAFNACFSGVRLRISARQNSV